MKSIVTLALFMLVCLMVALWLMSWPAKAQDNQCAERDSILAALADKYHEKPVDAGLVTGGEKTAIIELLLSPNAETWTLILSLPNGQSCLLASGTNWEALPTDTKPDAAKPDAGPKIDPNSGPSI